MIFEGARDLDESPAPRPWLPTARTAVVRALALTNAAWLVATVVVSAVLAEVVTRVILDERLLVWMGLGP